MSRDRRADREHGAQRHPWAQAAGVEWGHGPCESLAAGGDVELAVAYASD